MGGKTERAAPRKLRVYQQWQGNERFFCCGHCMAGPNWRSCVGSLLLLILPTAVFLIWVASYMGRQVSWAIFAVSCVLPCLCTAWLLLTACTDPGVLPRQEPDEEWLSGRKPRTKEVVVNGHTVQVRYNDTCHFYQPPRAHHCSVNDNCIERFDHHCPWVGTTIGKRNYRTFLLFIYGTTVYIMWTFAISLWSFWIKAKELQAASPGRPVDILNVIAANPAAVALCVLCFIFFWFVGGLSGFHTFLVASNQTTYENFSNQRRHTAGGVTNPYNVGVVRNCASVWCVRVPPPKIDYRAYVGEARRAQAAGSRTGDAPTAFFGSSEDGEPRSGGPDGRRRTGSGSGSGPFAAGGGVGAGGGGSAHDAWRDERAAAAAAALAGTAPEHVTIEMAAGSRGGGGGSGGAAAAAAPPQPPQQPQPQPQQHQQHQQQFNGQAGS